MSGHWKSSQGGAGGGARGQGGGGRIVRAGGSGAARPGSGRHGAPGGDRPGQSRQRAGAAISPRERPKPRAPPTGRERGKEGKALREKVCNGAGSERGWGGPPGEVGGPDRPPRRAPAWVVYIPGVSFKPGSRPPPTGGSGQSPVKIRLLTKAGKATAPRPRCPGAV